MSFLSAKKASFSYPLAERGMLDIFRNLDLDVRQGEILCILGPSGCGKSTLLKTLAGFLSLSGGRILSGGRSVHAPYQKGQMIFQDPSQLLPWLTVGENVVFSRKRKKILRLFHSSLTEGDRELETLLDICGLTEFVSFYPAQLSGGMKQRCALARALYAEPDILFMDEPFVSLDAPSRKGLQDLVLRLWQNRRITTLFVTHDIPEALLLADRILIMKGLDGDLVIRKNPLPRPRNRQNRDFLKEEAFLYSLLEASGRTS